MIKNKEKDSKVTQLDLYKQREKIEAEERAEKESEKTIGLKKEKEKDDDSIEPFSPREEYYTRFNRFR
jgi:hypothetical protein